MDRDDLRLVLAIQACRSLAAAGNELGVAAPAVTKRLSALEARLGHRLFERSTRHVAPTSEGELVCARARTLLEGFDALEDELRERRDGAVGHLRIAATFGFGRTWLGPAIGQFQLRHPDVQVDVQLTDRLPDLAAEGFDGAVWLWSAKGSQTTRWTSRRLARNERVLVGSPAYLAQHGTPASVDALSQHQFLTVRENAGPAGQRSDVLLLQRGRERTPATASVRVGGSLSANSGELARDWCLQGHGIMLRSLWDVAQHIAGGALVRVLPDWSMQDADVHWLSPWQPRMPRRTRLLLEHLLESFRDEPWLVRPRAAPARPGSRRTR